MPDKEQNTQSDFMIEKIKKIPINKGKLLRKTIVTILMAVIFGVIACLTFMILQPVINRWLYPEEPPEMVYFPEDSEEMLPEDMLAENQSTEPESSEESTEAVMLEENQIEEILSELVMSKEHYAELYGAMSDYVNELNQYMVTVTAVTSKVDWFSNVEEKQNQTSGLMLADNGKEVLILTDSTNLKTAEMLIVKFYNGTQAEAGVKLVDNMTGLAVLAVDFTLLPEDMQKEEMKYLTLGTSNGKGMLGTPVIALGAPMGTTGSMGYGIVTAENSVYSVPDRNFRIIHTDIVGSQSANGILFNMKGEIIGIITNGKTGYDMKNVISAYGVSEMRKTLEKLSNGVPFAYMGIMGTNVSTEANAIYGVPFGAYIKKVEMDSPAMLAGIQPGDVITMIDERNITSFSEYTTSVMQLRPGESLELTIQRQSQEGYREMKFTIEAGEVVK